MDKLEQYFRLRTTYSFFPVLFFWISVICPGCNHKSSYHTDQRDVYPVLKVDEKMESLKDNKLGNQEDSPAVKPSSVTAKVEIVWEKNKFIIYRNGAPFYIKGAAGRNRLYDIKKAGGNTIRTWSVAGLDTLLDRAQELGLVVLVGLDIGREREGFDYSDSAQVMNQYLRIEQVIKRFKDHPAVLAWIIGNEVDLLYTNKRVWKAVNDISKMIHYVDPNHPTSTAGLPGRESIKEAIDRAPDLDFLVYNVFGKALEFSEEFRIGIGDNFKPYVIGEFSGKGYWEVKVTPWNAPIEPSIDEKFHLYRQNYLEGFISDTTLCLGTCVFYWGEKQERTHTWFSMFLDERKTPLVDLMYYMWKGDAPDNHAPFLYGLNIDQQTLYEEIYLETDQSYLAGVESEDEEGDTLAYHWEILPEGNYENIFGGDKETRPQPVKGLFDPSDKPTLRFQAPSQPGPYRLFVYAYDGHQNVATANIPFYVMDHSLK